MSREKVLKEWVIQNLWRSRRYDKTSPVKIAGNASTELGDAISIQMIDEALHDIRIDKNFNLERYPFE